MTSILKPLGKIATFPPYDDSLTSAKRAYELYDLLENDDKMNQITELQLILEQAASFAYQLRKLDEQLKNILGNLYPEG